MKKNKNPSKYQLKILEQLLAGGVVLKGWLEDELEKEEIYLSKYLTNGIRIRSSTFNSLKKKGLIKEEMLINNFFTYSASTLAEKIIKTKYKDLIKKSKIPFHDFIEFSNLMKEYLARRNNDI